LRLCRTRKAAARLSRFPSHFCAFSGGPDAVVTRRLQRELTCRAEHGRGIGEQDAGRIPRRPVILGDNWMSDAIYR
jgi:hypothetical protein